MMPGEVLVESVEGFRACIKELFSKDEDAGSSIGIELRQQEDLFKFDLEIIKTDIFGMTDTKKLSSVLSAGDSGEFVDFGYGLNFSLSHGSINLASSFCNYFGYFKTNTDVTISDFYIKNWFSITANKITVQKSLISDFNLTLLAKSIENLGIISSPTLSVKTETDIQNSGTMSGQLVSLDATNIINHREGSLLSSGSLDIHAREKLLCDGASIRAKKLIAHTPKFHVLNMSYVKSDASFRFCGDEISYTDSTFHSEDGINILARHVLNLRSDISAKNRIDILTNIFQNDGAIKAGVIKTHSFLELINLSSLSNCTEIEEYEYISSDKRFGCIANSGLLQADEISMTAEKHLLNQKDIVARLKMNLTADGKVANKGTIQQLEYSPILLSQIIAKEGIANREGIIIAKSGFSLAGKSFDNTKGTLKARQLKMQLALDGEEKFRENKREVLAAQEERNPYSEMFQAYTKVARSTSFSADASPKSEKQKQESEDKFAGTEDKKFVPPEIGFLINTGGVIESDRSIDFKGSGAIYNAERGTISARESINIDMFGRLLNQLGGVISANSGVVKSAGKIFNTTGSALLGAFSFESNGFENGIGSAIRGGLRVKSITNIYNFGEIQALENPLFLSTDFTIRNYGLMGSEKAIELEAKEELILDPKKIKEGGLVNDSGKIIAPVIDVRKTSGVFNKKGGLIEAKTGDVIFKESPIFSNEGRISSNNLRLSKLIPPIPGSREINQNGVIDVRHSLFMSSIHPLKHIKGIINAPQFTFESRAGGTVDLAELLMDSGIRAQKANFSFPNARLENKSKTVLDFNTQIFADEFRNLSLLHCTGELGIRTNYDLVNAIADKDLGFTKGLNPIKKERPVFLLSSDWDIAHHTELATLLGSNEVYFSHERKLQNAFISSAGSLVLESGKAIRNIGSLRTEKLLTFKAPRVQHGWAYESMHHESLPELEFDYDYMESQPSYLVAEGGMNVEADVFLNTLGIIDVKGGLTSVNGKIFLNYGGSIDVRGDSVVTSPIFANAIGTIKTNRADQRYWSLEFCNTDSPTFNILDGSLAINSPYALNGGGHIFAQNGVLLEGTRSNGLPAVMDISSSGFGYGRMYSVNEYNCGSYTNSILGMSMATTGCGAIIRAGLNEKVQKRVLPASVSSQKQVVIDGYENLKSTGIIHGGAVHIKTGAGLTELGYTGDAILPSMAGFAKTVELFPYISSLAENQTLDVADGGDFFFKSAGGKLKIPFAIIDDETIDLTNLRLPFSPEVLEVMTTKCLQSAIGTGFLPDMPTFLAAAKMAQTTPQIRKTDAATFNHLKDYTSDQISLVSSEEAKHGLFFRPKKLGDHTLLFPELHLSPESVHATLANPAGATVAQGKQDANVVIDTDGFLHATASLHADDHVYAKAARGALFETSTYDAMAVTQNMFATTSRSGPLGLDSDTTYHKITEWHQIKKTREPMLVTTTRGDFVVIIPDDQQAEFKGAFSDITGNFEVHGGTCVLSPLEIAGVVPCPKIGDVSRISTMLPVFLQTVLKTKKDFLADVRVFKNTAGKIQALGDVVINASERIEFNTETRKFTLAEGMSVDEGTFTTKTSSRKVDDVMFAPPSVESGGNIKFKTDTANLSGQFKAEKDILLNARIAQLKSDLAYGTDDFRSNASNWFSSSSYTRFATFARVSPTIFQSHGDFIAEIADAYFEHSIQKVCRDERITAQHIDSSPLWIHETVVETRSSKGFDFFLPTSVLAPACDGNIREAIDSFWRQSSLLTATQSLLHSHRGADIAANGIGTALAAYSSLSAILEYGTGGAASLFGVGNFGFHSVVTKTNTTHNFTVPSVTMASGNIDWRATVGDIRITHRIAEARGNQRYTAAGKIFVAPGEDRTETTSTTQSYGANFNVFTMALSANVGGSSPSSKSTHYEASRFKSGGENIFSAGNGIFIVIPQIEGARNVFDALVVNLENKADEQETHSSSSGVGLSTNLAKAAAMTASANIGNSGSRDTFLNDAFIRGATGFMHSKVTNQGCLVMDIANQGASYQYFPGEEVHKSHNFAIGLSGLDLSSPEAFAYTLGRGLLSSAASAGVGMLASEAGLGGFVSSLAASIAGSYVNSELMPQRNFSDDPNWRPTGLGSNSSVQFEHDGRGFHAINVDFNQREFQATIDAVKTKIFEKSLDQGEPVAETVDLIRKTESDLTEIVNDAAATDAIFNEIDQHAKTETQAKIIEVAEDAPVALKRQAQRENLNTLSTTVRKSAQEKIRVIDEKIAAAEAKKAEISTQLQHIPGAQETLTTIFDSLKDTLYNTKNILKQAYKKPVETIHKMYTVSKLIKDDVSKNYRIVRDNIELAKHIIKREIVSTAISCIDYIGEKGILQSWFDTCSYLPVIGWAFEGLDDAYHVFVSGDTMLRPVVDKWNRYAFTGALLGKSARKYGNVYEDVADIVLTNGRDVVRDAQESDGN
jgi:adhesin HecA-like repeat protein